MPVSAPRVCGRCHGVHSQGERCGLVARDDRERKVRFDRKRPNSSRRGYDRSWEQAAKAFLARPENKFCACGAKAVLVRHVVSIRARPDLRMNQANWRPGCQRCNQLDAARERQPQKGNRHG